MELDKSRRPGLTSQKRVRMALWVGQISDKSRWIYCHLGVLCCSRTTRTLSTLMYYVFAIATASGTAPTLLLGLGLPMRCTRPLPTVTVLPPALPLSLSLSLSLLSFRPSLQILNVHSVHPAGRRGRGGHRQSPSEWAYRHVTKHAASPDRIPLPRPRPSAPSVPPHRQERRSVDSVHGHRDGATHASIRQDPLSGWPAQPRPTDLESCFQCSHGKGLRLFREMARNCGGRGKWASWKCCESVI